MIRNVLQPTGDQVRSFRDRRTGEPVAMLNLLKFRDRAVYEDGGDAGRTGREAYEVYAAEFRRLMEPRGVRVLYAGEARGVMIGEAEGAWDALALIGFSVLEFHREQDTSQVVIVGMKGVVI